MEQSKLDSLLKKRSELENLKLHYLNLYTIILNEQFSIKDDKESFIANETKRIYTEDQLKEICLKLKKLTEFINGN